MSAAPGSAPAARATRLVLLVDDDPDMLHALRRTLRSADYQIVAVSSPRDAARLLEGQRIDLVLSDVDMPGMNGHELMALARRACPGAVRILLTGSGTMESALRAINEGEVHRYVTKPFDAVALRRLVAEALERQDELSRVAEVAERLDRRHMLLRQLEEEHPGLTAVERTPEGAYSLDVEGACARAGRIGLGAFVGKRHRTLT
jgi:two-component system, probable response regulator PhcQ